MYKLEVQWEKGSKWSYIGHYSDKSSAMKDGKKYEDQLVYRIRIVKSS